MTIAELARSLTSPGIWGPAPPGMDALPLAWCRALAARAALRVAPLLQDEVLRQDCTPATLAEVVVPILRCYPLALAAALNGRATARLRATALIVWDRLSDAEFALDRRKIAGAAAWYAVFAAQYAVGCSLQGSQGAPARLNRAHAASTMRYACSAMPEALPAAIGRDLTDLMAVPARADAADRLLRQPLWPDGQTPPAISAARLGAHAVLRSLGEGWELWPAIFDAVSADGLFERRETPWPAPVARARLTAITMLEDGLWTGPAPALNAAIGRCLTAG